jgi:serine/threonine protein kinase
MSSHHPVRPYDCPHIAESYSQVNVTQRETVQCPCVVFSQLKNRLGGSRLINTCNEETMLTMVLEYIPTDLKKHMDMLQEEGERLTQHTVKCYMWQLLRGLYFLHRTGVMHRSVYPALPPLLPVMPRNVSLANTHTATCTCCMGRCAALCTRCIPRNTDTFTQYINDMC